MKMSWGILKLFLLLHPRLLPRTNTCIFSLSCQFSFLTANKLSLGQLNFQEACQGIVFISIKRNEMGKKRKRLDSPQNASCAPLFLLGGISAHSAFQVLRIGLMGGVDPPWLHCLSVCVSFPPFCGK